MPANLKWAFVSVLLGPWGDLSFSRGLSSRVLYGRLLCYLSINSQLSLPCGCTYPIPLQVSGQLLHPSPLFSRCGWRTATPAPLSSLWGVWRWVPSCTCWTLAPHGQFWSCTGEWDLLALPQISLGDNPWQVDAEQLAPPYAFLWLCIHHRQWSTACTAFVACIFWGRPLVVPAWASVSLGQITRVCRPIADNSWPC